MTKTDKLNLLRAHFMNKEYGGVTQMIRQNKELQISKIVNEEQAEIAAIASFSFYNVKAYNESLSFSLKLLRHIESNNQIVAARNLYENLIILIADLYIQPGKPLHAYLTARNRRNDVIIETGDVTSHFNKIKEELAAKIGTVIFYLLLAMSIIIVVLQRWLHIIGDAAYLATIVVMIVFILFTWRGSNGLTKLIESIL